MGVELAVMENRCGEFGDCCEFRVVLGRFLPVGLLNRGEAGLRRPVGVLYGDLLYTL